MQTAQELSKQDINELPLYKYEGETYLVRTSDELEAAVQELALEKILGFDTETKPNFRKGCSNNPALVQLASSRAVYIFQLKFLPFGPQLASLLANTEIIKAGVATRDDIKALVALHEFKSESMVDLGAAAERKGIKMHGLRGLAGLFLNVRISKSARCSNWGAENLSKQQIAYAATDAWISREIYLKMQEAALL